MSTVGELHDRYWPIICARVSAGTARGYSTAYRRRVGPTFGEIPIQTVTALDVEVAFVSWSGSRSTRIDAIAALSHICKIAIKGRLIAVNPCEGLELPREQPSDPAARALNPDEVRLLLRELPHDGPYRRFVLAMLFTGCRLGEVAGMRVSDVDMQSRSILVARTASAGLHGELVVGPTKGRRGRSVPLADPLVPLVAEAIAGKGPHDLLFPGPRGGHINSQNLSRALNWRSVRERVKKFPPGEPLLHWHDLRHTAAVTLFLAGSSAPDVQAVMGHASLQVTQLYVDTRKEAARRSGPLLSSYYALLERSISDGGGAEKSGL